MYLRKCRSTQSKKDRNYWQLVESYRTSRGPRQRVVAYLGDISQSEGEGIKQAAEGKKGGWQSRLFDESEEPQWVEIDISRVRVGRVREFGSYWLGMQLLEKLDLVPFLDRSMPAGLEEIKWSLMSQVLVLMRLSEPSSELSIVEDLYERSPLSDLLGIPVEKVNDHRLYRTLDKLLPHKPAL